MPRKKIPHFRFYPTDFLDGTKDMSAANVGDYIRLLCAIYDQDGRVLNDPYALRHLLGVPRAVDASKAVERLIWFGKLWVDSDGYLRNGRADEEIEKRHEFQTRNPAAKGAAKGAALGVTGTPKKRGKTKGAGTLARAFPNPKDKSSKEVPYLRAQDGDDSAAMAGSPGCEGRSPAMPKNNGHDPPGPELAEKLAALAAETVPGHLFEKLKGN
jgi:uncharacterized protein YdaU (DUF1376 family)